MTSHIVHTLLAMTWHTSDALFVAWSAIPESGHR